MNNKNYTRAKVLTLIPLILFAFLALCCLIDSAIPPSSEGLSNVLQMILTLGFLFLPVPCLIMAIAGIVCASDAKKEGIAQARVFFVIGLIEIIAIIVSGVVFGVYMLVQLFTVSMGV